MSMKEFHSHRISQLHDAQMDMIVKLNHLTDIPYDPQCHTPDFQDYKAMEALAKAIKDLQKTICMIEELEDKEEEEMEEEMMARMACNSHAAHSASHMANAKSPQP